MISPPYATGNRGGDFENRIQSIFVFLMFTGRPAPGLPIWPITKVQLQGAVDGYQMDDVIVFVDNPDDDEQCKLLGEIKSSIEINKGVGDFGKVIKAAWSDFNNPKVFKKGRDVIALITSELSATDKNNVQWLLEHAKKLGHGQASKFFERVRNPDSCSKAKRDKCEVIEHHLMQANGDTVVPDDEVYDFLRHFRILQSDFGENTGFNSSLLLPPVSQLNLTRPDDIWLRVADFVKKRNPYAAIITRSDIPTDISKILMPKTMPKTMMGMKKDIEPEESKPKEIKRQEIAALPALPKTNWREDPDAIHLVVPILVGIWSTKSEGDCKVISQLLGSNNYGIWLQNIKRVLHRSDSPLSFKNGIWKISDRTEIWKQIGSYIFDDDLDRFRAITIDLLEKTDPVFESSTAQQYPTNIDGGVLEHSHVLRKGIAEGLALIGCRPDTCRYCTERKADDMSILVIRKILDGADWVRWGSLDNLLPTLAEAAPDEFLDAVNEALRRTPCPFSELFAKKGDGITSGNYLAGLLWALEGLAWDEKYFVRVCVILGQIASHDPGSQWADRSVHSLITILLPWWPQTTASIEKRKVAVKTIIKEYPDIGWNLIISLLPNRIRTSSDSYKPKWRRTIPDDWQEGVTPQEYRQQADIYAKIAVEFACKAAIKSAGMDITRLSELVDHFNNLPNQGFERLVEFLTSPPVSELPECQRLPLWERLRKFSHKHRKGAGMGAKWALPDSHIARIVDIAERLAPKDLVNLYHPLFTDDNFDLYDGYGDWKERREELNTTRKDAVREILMQQGIDGVISFSETVGYPYRVGYALGSMEYDTVEDKEIESALIPRFLDPSNKKYDELVSGYITSRHKIIGWEGCDIIDRQEWNLGEIGYFLACLPSTNEAWTRASDWLGKNQKEYWSRANVDRDGGDLTIAIEKFIEYGNPYHAIIGLGIMRDTKQRIDVSQCVRALLAALSTDEQIVTRATNEIIELIEFLQSEPHTDREDMIRIEWGCLSLLKHHSGFIPRYLGDKLANDPKFFCEIIQLAGQLKEKNKTLVKLSKKSRANIGNALRLMDTWKTPPGMKKGKKYSGVQFKKWFKQVKTICEESGHLEFALSQIGRVFGRVFGGDLIHTSIDPNKLWIPIPVVEVLNEPDADIMRARFRTGAYGAQGIHMFSPDSNIEIKLARRFRSKADEVEDAGFHRFAATLRELANDYERDMKYVIMDLASLYEELP